MRIRRLDPRLCGDDKGDGDRQYYISYEGVGVVPHIRSLAPSPVVFHTAAFEGHKGGTIITGYK